MAQRLYCFLVVFLLIFPGKIFGQQQPGSNCLKTSPVTIIKSVLICDGTGWNGAQKLGIPVNIADLLKLPVKYNESANFNFENQLKLDPVIKDSANPQLTPHLLFKPSIFSSSNIHPGFFCKKELQLEKITTVPLRFRLGSLEYVNWMEQKPNAIKPGLH